MDDKGKNKALTLYIILLILCVLYRGYIVIHYGSQFVDDDQALMWNGAAAFAHFMFPEPCFWGQSYGSMFESSVAAPLLWAGVPIHWAMPIATTLVSFVPYLFISLSLYRKERKSYAFLVFFLYLLMGWKWDILTSVPRSFISGMPFATLGAILLNDRRSNAGAFAGAFLICLGIIQTTTALLAAGMGILFYLWNIRKNYSRIPAVFLGAGLGVLVFLFIKSFYVINADFSLHPTPQADLSLSVLFTNLKNLKKICSDFIFIETGTVVIIAFLAIILAVVLTKRWLTLIMLIANVLGMVGLFSLSKTLDYGENSVFFAQTRMFLCGSYSWLIIIHFDAEQYGCEWVKKIRKRELTAIVGMGLAVFILLGKGMAIDFNIKNPESSLNNPSFCGLYKTSQIIKAVKEIDAYAEQQGADVIVTRNDRRGLSYAIDAIHFGKYTVYNITYDRRTWNYQYLRHIQPHRCVFVDYFDDSCNMDTVDISDESVVQYIATKYNIYRNPYSWEKFTIENRRVVTDVFCTGKGLFSLTYGLQGGRGQDFPWTKKHFGVFIRNKQIGKSGLRLSLTTALDSYKAQLKDLPLYIKLYVNGEYIADLDVINGNKEYVFKVPNHKNDVYEVELKTNAYFCPAKLGMSKDSRELSLAVYYVGD